MPTIKYYLREGLLPAGQETAATQAEYDDAHVERLRLIRLLREVGSLPVSQIRDVMAAIDDSSRPLHDVIGSAHHAIGPRPQEDTAEFAGIRSDIVEHFQSRGWEVLEQAPAFDILATTLVALHRLGTPARPQDLDLYADAVFALAGLELTAVDPSRGPADTVTQAVVGTVLFEQVLLAVRRLALEHHSSQRFGSGELPPAWETTERAIPPIS